MPGELTANLFSQLVYLDVVPGAGDPATVGGLCDYYTQNPVGRAFLQARFGAIALEYAGWQAFLQEGLADVRGWQVVHVFDRNHKNESGLYACTYRSPQGELVTAFRGSELLGNGRYKNDYISDMALAYQLTTPQQRDAEAYLRARPQFTAEPFTLTGHSLGGNLALHAAVHAPDPEKVRACFAFNAPGFNRQYISKNKKKIKRVRPVLTAFENEFDPVSSMLLNIVKPDVVLSAFDPGAQEPASVEDLLYPHSNFVFQRAGDRFARREDGRKSTFCDAVYLFTRSLLLLPESVRKTIAELLLDAIYRDQSPEKQEAYLLEAATRTLARSGIADKGAGGLAVSSALYAAQQLAKQPHDADTLRRQLEEHGRGDTARAALLLFTLIRHICRGEEPGTPAQA